MKSTVYRIAFPALALACCIATSSVAQKAVQGFELSPATYTMHITLPPGTPERYRAKLASTKVNGTLRFRFAVAAGGRQFRVRLSNELGHEPLTIGAASVALAGDGVAAKAGSLHALTFNGNTTVVIPAGAPVLSDPVDLHVEPMSELLASVFVDQYLEMSPLAGVTMMRLDGDATANVTYIGAQPVSGRPLVTGVLLDAPKSAPTIVAFGDSITDGARTDPAKPHGWADLFARRLAASHKTATIISAGIGGNRVLSDGWGPAALARADRDVFAVPGVTHVILLEGINDIGMSGSSAIGQEAAFDREALLHGYEQIAARAHARGVKIYIGTLTPFRGAPYFTAAKEIERLAINDWIRSSRSFDGVIDFEAALRDPSKPDQLVARFDSGDHLHPSDAGYQAMANIVPIDIAAK